MTRNFEVSCLLVVMLAWGGINDAMAAPAGLLRYGADEEQAVAYEIAIRVDLGSKIENLKGIVTYQLKPTPKLTPNSQERLGVTYKGGLTKRTAHRGGSSGSNRIGGGFRPGPPPSPFVMYESMTFQGLRQTTTTMSISRRGEIKSFRGSSQLPYLLGNASLLVFEPLPEESQDAWTVEGNTAITEEGTASRFPFSPLAGVSRQRAGASETTKYRVESRQGPLVVVGKTYDLSSVGMPDGGARFDIDGSGTWVFNQELGVSESMEFEQKLTVRQGGVELSVPITITYRRLTAEQLAEIERERKEKEEEKKRKEEEVAANRMATPLTDHERKQILNYLRSERDTAVRLGIQLLKNRRPHGKADDSIAIALARLRSDPKHNVQQALEEVLPYWPLSDEAQAVVARADREAGRGMRTWTDDTGEHSIEAEFVDLADGMVRLRRPDGSELTIPLNRLSTSDVKAVLNRMNGVDPAKDVEPAEDFEETVNSESFGGGGGAWRRGRGR